MLCSLFGVVTPERATTLSLQGALGTRVAGSMFILLSLCPLSVLAAVRTVFTAPVQEAAPSSLCPIKEHCERGVPKSRVSVGCHYVPCTTAVQLVLAH